MSAGCLLALKFRPGSISLIRPLSEHYPDRCWTLNLCHKISQESVVRSQCESVISQMKEELLRYAENANRQALEYVEKAVSQSKESTAAKYKKYYQRLV